MTPFGDVVYNSERHSHGIFSSKKKKLFWLSFFETLSNIYLLTKLNFRNSGRRCIRSVLAQHDRRVCTERNPIHPSHAERSVGHQMFATLTSPCRKGCRGDFIPQPLGKTALHVLFIGERNMFSNAHFLRSFLTCSLVTMKTPATEKPGRSARRFQGLSHKRSQQTYV